MALSIDFIESNFREHHQRLANVAYNITRDKDAAKDVVQDVFLKIWQRKNSFEKDFFSSGYLYKSVVNTSLNFLEKNKKTVKIQSSVSHRIASTEELPDSKIVGKELEKEVDLAIDNLPPKCKTIFVLSRFEGLKYNEIAQQLEISPKTVENQMSIALKKLHTQLRPYLTKEFLTLMATVGIPAILGSLSLFFLLCVLHLNQ
ncbi:RNA polymerase sigma-70 factor [Crocinitomix catalasitica]|nr:RNA polymerase sigma-70 factor [Crocinitomix catalasitica]